MKIILEIIASLFKFFSNKQLLDAGKAEALNNVHEATRKADIESQKEIAIADAIRADAANLSDDFLLPPSERAK